MRNRRFSQRFSTWSAEFIQKLEPRRLLSVASSAAAAQAAYGTSDSVVLQAGMATPEGYSDPNGAPITPSKMRGAYGLGTYNASNVTFNGVQGDGRGQTIALMEGGYDPDIQADLNAFDAYWDLPDVTVQTFNSTGGTNMSGTSIQDIGELDLDVEWAHVMAPAASLDVYAGSLYTCMTTAKNNPSVTVISVSYGISGTESVSEFETPTNRNGSGVTFTASAGDAAGDMIDPAKSPAVVGVGGTDLTTSGNNYSSETAWDDGGGGINTGESQPTYQNGVVSAFSTTQRTVPDVSLDADPGTGVAVYDEYDNGTSTPWSAIIGGTSLSSPLMAGIIAVADQGRVAAGLQSLDGYTQTLPRLYELYRADYSANYHDITSGTNAYPAGTGYDLATGIGSPRGNALIPDLAGADTITGRVFLDANGNGIYDGSDTAMSGKIVYLDVNDTGVQTSSDPTATTNSSGIYTFSDQIGSMSGVVRLATLPSGDLHSTTPNTFTTSYDATQTVNLGFYVSTYTAVASPTTVSGTATALSISGTGPSDASSFTFTWAATTEPTGASPVFSANGTNAAQNSTVTFNKAGSYTFTVTIADGQGSTVTSTVNVTVNQTATAVALSPTNPNITAGQTEQLSAAVNDQFGNPITADAITWTLTSGGGGVSSAGLYTSPATGTLAVVKAASGSLSASTNVYVVSSPWISADIGTPAIAGSAYDSSGTFTIAGAGTGIGGTADQLHYVYQTLAANGAILAEVDTQQNTNAYAQAGVLIRSALDAGSPGALMSVSPSHGLQFISRTSDGGSTTSVSLTTNTAPYWVELIRTGSQIVGYYSANGTTWTAESSVNLSATGSMYIGMMVSSLSTTTASTATINNVFLSPTINSVTASPSPATGTTVGLSVSATDESGASNLTYSWSTTSRPAGSSVPTFSSNSNSSAASTTATLSMAGSYTFAVTATNKGGLTATGSVTVVVNQTLTSVTVSPTTAFVYDSGTSQFSATANDQFGNALATQPTFNWSVDNGGVGTVGSSGLFTGPASGPGSATVRATTGSVSGTAAVTVILSVIDGTGGNDTIRLVRSSTNLLVYLNNPTTPLYTVAYSSLGSLTVAAGTGNDQINVDFSGGAIPVPAGGLSIDGGAGTDSLIITGTTGNDSASINASTVSLNGSSFSYANIDAVTFNGNGGADSLSQTAQPGNNASLVFNATTTGGPSASDTLNVSGGAFSFAAPAPNSGEQPISLASLSIASGATVSIGSATAESDRWAMVLGALNITGGTLDLGANDLVVHNGNLTALFDDLQIGAAGGAWTGAGITSTAAENDTTHMTALGIIPNTDVSGAPIYSSFDNQPASSTDVLVKYTYVGDATLDGKVDASDYSRIDNGYLEHLTGWWNGDFNYDGGVDGSDYTLIDNAFNTQSAAMTSQIAPASVVTDKPQTAKPAAMVAAKATGAATSIFSQSQIVQQSDPTTAVAADSTADFLFDADPAQPGRHRLATRFTSQVLE